MVSVRAVYHNGQLRLLEPLDLQEGQEVQIQIIQQPGRLADAMADLLVRFDEDSVESALFDEDSTQSQLDAALKGKRPLSEIIIEERREDS